MNSEEPKAELPRPPEAEPVPPPAAIEPDPFLEPVAPVEVEKKQKPVPIKVENLEFDSTDELEPPNRTPKPYKPVSPFLIPMVIALGLIFTLPCGGYMLFCQVCRNGKYF